MFFVQYACSWGQIWTKDRWNDFYEWYEKNKDKDFMDYSQIPINVKKWGNNSWLKFHVIYTVLNNKYFVYPQIGLTSNFTDGGTHNRVSGIAYQCNVYYNNKEEIKFRFEKLENAYNVYDAFFENVYLNRILKSKNQVIADFYGEKEEDFNQQETPFVLSTKMYNYEILDSFSLQMYPYEMNIINGIEGDDIFLYNRNNITYNQKNKKNKKYKLLKYTYKLDLLSKRYILLLIGYFFDNLKDRIVRKIKKE